MKIDQRNHAERPLLDQLEVLKEAEFKYRGEITDLKIKPDKAEVSDDEESALPPSDNDYSLSGKALSDYLNQLASDAEK
jgi:hypothetical protein